ncbi:MAG: M12 family metallopeptidase [Trueperaceae bacterium]|nr:M12 family metallopeptidase [Trueperaceae bacterium]
MEELADAGFVAPQSNAAVPHCIGYKGVVYGCKWLRWTDAVVPYTFKDDWGTSTAGTDQNAMMRARILAAMQQIEGVSLVRFVPHTSQPSKVVFRSSDGCSSWLGMKPGGQPINLSVACGEATVVHEILHALGFLHEQARHDRDGFVAIQWDNIQSKYKSQFERKSYAVDVGPYDYGSIMHYHAFAWCKESAPGTCVGPTIVTIPPGVPIGQRNALSAGDVAAINLLYPGEPPTITITDPSPGSSYSRRVTNVFLSADVVDPEGLPVTITWVSDVSGVLGTGSPLTVFTGGMAYGQHIVTARAVDAQGNEATDTVAIEIVNDPPVVEVLEPRGAGFCVGESIRFRASVLDVNEPGATLPDSRVSWRVGATTPFAFGKVVDHAFDMADSYHVIVRAVDELAEFDEDSVVFNVYPCSDLPPTVTITTPAGDATRFFDGFDAERGLWYADMRLAGHADDPEDGALTGGSLVWFTSQKRLQATQLGTGSSLIVRLYADVDTGVEHVITLQATDSAGNVRVATVRVFIYTIG